MNGQGNASNGSIVIPTSQEIEISNGDYVLDGIVTDEYNLEELLKNYDVFKVVSVRDNRRGSLQHYKIGVQE